VARRVVSVHEHVLFLIFTLKLKIFQLMLESGVGGPAHRLAGELADKPGRYAR